MAGAVPEAFTAYGWLTCLWVLVVSFQYGYHISALNQIQAVLTCQDVGTTDPATAYGLPTCIPMTDARFSVVTAVYTIGGLLGSLVANVIMDRYGRKGAIKGAVGVLTQFAIVIGIFVTQAMGLRLATPEDWRTVLMFSSALSLVQLLVSGFIVESPSWLTRHGRFDDRILAAQKLWAHTEATFGVTIIPYEDDAPAYEESDAPLLGGMQPDVEEQIAKDPESHDAAISIPQLLMAPELRRPLTIVCFSMLCQQCSGVNAVLYYSNDILSKALPDVGPYVSLGITIVNVMMTFPPIFLIERMGRKTLLTISALGALASLVCVGFGLNSGLVGLASVAIIAFIASFAVGIGPVPFVMIPEVSPLHAVSALSSVGLSLNWIINFGVGIVFLPLRNMLSDGDPAKEGRVFYVFAGMLAFCTVVLLNVYRGKKAPVDENGGDASAKKEKGSWRRPANTAFKQQRLKAWQPIFTPKTVLPIFFIIGIIFAPIGALLIWGSGLVTEITLDYTDCDTLPPSSSASSLNFTNMNDFTYRLRASQSHAPFSAPQFAFVNDSTATLGQNQQCFIQFDIPYDLEPTVLLYYKLTNFYQNHRRYVKSLNTDQLKGDFVSVSTLQSGDCKPLARFENASVTLAIYPCGLIANSVFNDTYSVLNLTTDSNTNYTFSEKGIAWPGEAKKYATTPGYDISQIIPPPNWGLRFPNGYTNATPPPDLKSDEHFQNWMRTAGLPTFTKLWGRNDNDQLLKGRYQIIANMNYPVRSYKGHKAIVISTVSWIGGKNPFLGWAYVAAASLFVALAILGTIRHMIKPRKLGDMSLLSWNR
ncbi:hypothetical protein EUX98_g2430 [Antrodiella citrinella]|uniref:Major facilitator superfamily (MFS) profile domain-containing protein n=1 Tax=Antrodiella citrinella TaxID=2447956 RepID=A0A4S4N7A5_9APHY|nr:hypothetical protein EUX98_g2430 [Antrodiella citrinella]